MRPRQYITKAKIIRKRNTKVNFNDIANTILFLAVFVGIWQLTFMLGIFPRVLLPSPAMVAQSFAQMGFSLITNIAWTMWRLLIGFSISIMLGVGIGLVMVKFKDFGKTMSSFAVGLQSFPSIAWVPFSILFIGLNDFGILFVVIMSSVFSVMLATYSGIRNIPPLYISAARNMGASGLPLFRYVMLPAATPSLIIGLTQAWSFAWHALIGAEILMSAFLGLGHILDVGREFQLMDQIIASMITIFAIGLVFDRLVFSKIANKVRDRWGLNRSNE
ncbi:MAG TPA: ABC transporter permease [Candidatus Acidoferrum sp.]|nr:ABC transporter permease [Candidatus Acidoferrum sp.]